MSNKKFSLHLGLLQSCRRRISLVEVSHWIHRAAWAARELGGCLTRVGEKVAMVLGEVLVGAGMVVSGEE